MCNVRKATIFVEKWMECAHGSNEAICSSITIFWVNFGSQDTKCSRKI